LTNIKYFLIYLRNIKYKLPIIFWLSKYKYFILQWNYMANWTEWLNSSDEYQNWVIDSKYDLYQKEKILKENVLIDVELILNT